MFNKVIEPLHPSLSHSIDRIWTWENTSGESPLLPTLIPGTGAEVIFHYGQPISTFNSQGELVELPQAYMLALRNKSLPQIATGPVGFIAARFKTGMLQHFTQLRGDELLEGIWAVEDLWGAAGRDLAAQIVAASKNVTRAKRLNGFLSSRQNFTSSDVLMEHAAQKIYYTEGNLQIERLAIAINLSRRQLERRFKEASGVSPSTMRRIARLQKFTRSLLLTGSQPTLDEVLRHGYYDQSHFHRDLRSLSGESPATFFASAHARPHFYLPSCA